MERALLLLAAIALGTFITVKRVQHRFLPESIYRLFRKRTR